MSSDRIIVEAIKVGQNLLSQKSTPVVADQSKTNRHIITRLWGVFDDPHLNQALGIPDNRGKMVRPPKGY
jgi:hypothetical protein